MKKRQILRRLIIDVSVVALLVGVLLFVFYLRSAALTTKLKDTLISSIAKETAQSVTIDDVHFTLFKGLVVKGLTVYEPTGAGTNVTLEAEEVSFRAFVLPFVKRKYIIPTLVIKNLRLNAGRQAPGKWNITSLPLVEEFDAKRLSEEYPFAIYKIAVRNSVLHLTDNATSPPFSKDLSIKRATVALLPNLRFTVNGSLQGENQTGTIVLKGSYGYGSKAFVCTAKTYHFPLDELTSYYQKGVPLEVRHAPAHIRLRLVADKTNKLSLDGKYSIRDARLGYENVTAHGTISGNLKLSRTSGAHDTLSYHVLMSLKNFTIENVALVKTITDLNGEIVLNPQEIRTKNMKARVAGETVTVEAGIDDVATAQRLEAKIRAETSLKNIEPLVRDQLGENLKDIALDGDAQVLLSVTDSLTDDAPARIVSSIEFGNASLAAPITGSTKASRPP
jgi:hypothetical protein